VYTWRFNTSGDYSKQLLDRAVNIQSRADRDWMSEVDYINAFEAILEEVSR
jgi:hypothetical protein